MIQEAKAESCVREVVPLNVVFLYGVIDIVGQAHVLSCRATALIFICRNVSAEIQCTEAVACYGLLGPATLCHFDADVIALGALLAEETNATPVEIVGATWCS